MHYNLCSVRGVVRRWHDISRRLDTLFGCRQIQRGSIGQSSIAFKPGKNDKSHRESYLTADATEPYHPIANNTIGHRSLQKPIHRT